MWWLSSLFAVLLLPAIGNAGCEDELRNCTFMNSFCKWEHPNWTRNRTVDNRYARLNNNKQSGNITSKMRCVSSNISHCMKFRFYLEKSDDNILNVSIKRSLENTEELLWTYSTKTNFSEASVPIKSGSEFVLIFRGRQEETDDNDPIRVDDFKYEQSGCNIEPSSAAPPQAATTKYPIPTTTTTASTTLENSTEVTTFVSKTSAAVPDTNTAVNTSASSSITDAIASSDNTGTIVGALFAVIAVALIVIIVFLVLRRKQSPLLTVCLQKKKKDAQQQSGSNNRAFHSESPHDTELDDSNRAPTYANTFNDSTSMVNPDVSTNHYSVIRDVVTDVTSSAFQPSSSLYCNARVLQSTHKEDEDSKTEVPSPYANQYDVVGDELGICQARVSSKAVEYKNLTVGKSHQTGASSDRTKSSNSKSEDSSSACSLVQSATPDDTVYQNTKEGSLSHSSSVQDRDTKRAELKKGGVIGEERAIEGEYYNVEKTTTHHDPEATSKHHILKEDPQSGQEETQTGSVYHVLEPDPLATEPSKRTIGVYHIFEDTETQMKSPNENPVASKASSHSNTCLSEGVTGDYYSLDFQKGRGGDVAGYSGDETGQIYSHLNEAGEDTYSELSREKKREVVDGDYSHVTLD